ncbi:MAG: hypothetical protein R3F34_04180 [Planctomycetota bacterium]
MTPYAQQDDPGRPDEIEPPKPSPVPRPQEPTRDPKPEVEPRTPPRPSLPDGEPPSPPTKEPDRPTGPQI